MAQGCLQRQQQGLAEPKDVRMPIESYQDEMDPLSDWVTERCVVADGLQGVGLYLDYAQWAKESGREALDGRTFKAARRSRKGR